METENSESLFEVARRGGDILDQPTLFGDDDSRHDYWWGLPNFDMKDIAPQRRIEVNFQTAEDYLDFQRRLDIKLSATSDSMWWPVQNRLKPKQYVWRGVPSGTKYPVYIPSKGRFDCATAPGLLNQAGVKFWLVVEPQEYDLYQAEFGDCVLKLPFSNLGQGSIPARNWIWEHAKENGAPWHWIIDDNVHSFHRTHGNRRLIVERSSAPLRIVEDFIDRYDNFAFAGLSMLGFAPDRYSISPISFNTRIYSVTLINTSLSYRWRGRYNEDTDLCLRALKDGWATALFRAMLFDKASTSRGDGKTGMKGGNTDTVYNGMDYRRAFADSLKEQHPDCVEVVWKYGRWHHEVNYKPFKRNAFTMKPGIVPHKQQTEYDLQLVHGADE